jgi:hypothetical protein
LDDFFTILSGHPVAWDVYASDNVDIRKFLERIWVLLSRWQCSVSTEHPPFSFFLDYSYLLSRIL